MTFDAGRVRHDGALMHYSRGSNGSSIPSNWKLSATGDTGVTWTPESAGGSVSYGSNANAVGTANAGGASTNVSRADHVHLGVRGVSSNGSNTLVGDVNLQAGSGIALGVAAQSITITNTGSAGGGGSVSYGSNSNEVSYANAAGASSLVSRADHVHRGVTSVSHTSNTFAGPVILTASGTAGITSPTPGTYNISAFGQAGGGGGSSGALVLLEQHTASSSATLDFTAWYSSTYDDYLVEFLGLLPATNTNQLALRVSTDGGSSYDSGTNYDYSRWFMYPTAAGGEGAVSATYYAVGGASIDNSHQGVTGSVRLHDPAASVYKTILSDTVRWVASGINVPVRDTSSGQYRGSAYNAFRVLFTSGNITSGTVRVYGLTK